MTLDERYANLDYSDLTILLKHYLRKSARFIDQETKKPADIDKVLALASAVRVSPK